MFINSLIPIQLAIEQDEHTNIEQQNEDQRGKIVRRIWLMIPIIMD